MFGGAVAEEEGGVGGEDFGFDVVVARRGGGAEVQAGVEAGGGVVEIVGFHGVGEGGGGGRGLRDGFGEGGGIFGVEDFGSHCVIL